MLISAENYFLPNLSYYERMSLYLSGLNLNGMYVTRQKNDIYIFQEELQRGNRIGKCIEAHIFLLGNKSSNYTLLNIVREEEIRYVFVPGFSYIKPIKNRNLREKKDLIRRLNHIIPSFPVAKREFEKFPITQSSSIISN